MNYVDFKYVGLLSSRLDRFSVKGTQPYRANFRCPLCGDSEKSARKARGWILEGDNGDGFYFCHNCGASQKFDFFLKTQDPILYNDYVADRLLDKDTYVPEPEPKPEPPKPKPKSLGIKKISQLMPDHPARQYVENRKIPRKVHYRLYYAPKFVSFINKILPGKLDPEKFKEHPRLVIPFIDKGGRVFGVQGRSFTKNDLRYITIMFDESKPKVFGLNEVDFNTKYYIVEGPIDSLFLRNSVAMAGADVNTSGLKNIENGVFVFDNEPRNRDIVRRMEKVINKGHKICIWSKKVLAKDVNDLILSGYSTADIQLIIDQNTFSGLQATLRLSEWKSV